MVNIFDELSNHMLYRLAKLAAFYYLLVTVILSVCLSTYLSTVALIFAPHYGLTKKLSIHNSIYFLVNDYIFKNTIWYPVKLRKLSMINFVNTNLFFMMIFITVNDFPFHDYRKTLPALLQ